MGGSKIAETVLSDEPFGIDWAMRKLDMPRRRMELTAYIDTWLPELRSLPPGFVVDIGCGPGDFLAICGEIGHDGLGIDAPRGRGGMGDAYLSICREERQRLGVRVAEIGMLGWIEDVLSRNFIASACCINARGSIEQALGTKMIGDPHDRHHNCRLLDWDVDAAPYWFDRLMQAVAKTLVPGGILLIAANGTRNTDMFYERAIQAAAAANGLRLVGHKPPLLHKWVLDSN